MQIEHPFRVFQETSKLFSLHPFLQSAIDCSFWDLYGKLNNKTFAELNQLHTNHFPQSSITISMDEEAVQLQKIIESDWEYCKVKVNSWSTSFTG
jgi:L-Ala-D/L-Glu epimerase